MADERPARLKHRARAADATRMNAWRSALARMVLIGVALGAGASSATAAATTTVPAPATVAPTPDLRAIHDALFDAYFPAAQLPLADSLRRMVPAVREGLWRRFEAEPSVQRTLVAFAHLDRLAASTPSLASALSPGTIALSDLAPPARDSALALLLASEDATARRLAGGTRMLYLRAIYGSELGLRIARARSTPVLHPDVADFVKSHQPQLPASTLHYDRERHELRARSGVIDDIVVGSGPAGSVIATELRRAGRRVLLIDQGPFVIPGAMNSRKPSELIESGGRRSSASGSVFFNNGQAVGGGTTVNIDLAFAPTLPIVQHRIESWRRDGRIGPDVTPEAVRNAYAWVRQRVGTRTPGTSEINPNNQVLWDGARRQGLTPDLYDLNTFPPGAWQSPVSDKRSAVSGFLLQALQQADDPLQLVPDARVLEILLDRGAPRPRATGVRFVVRAPWNAPGVWPDPLGLEMTVGDTVTVQASRVIVSAGTLGSAALLLRSGIANPNIGVGIVAHPAMPVIGEFDHRIDNQLGTIATVFVDDYAERRGFLLEAMSAGPDYAAMMAFGNGRDVYSMVSRYPNLAGFGVMLVDSVSSSNKIALDSGGEPVIYYELSAGDRERMRFALGEAVRLMFRAGARRVWVPTDEAGVMPLTRAGQIDSLVRVIRFVPGRTILTSAHLQASNKMGSHETDSVVDWEHRVWGCDQLFVADASTFPESIGANPMQSIYTFAKLFVDRLVASDRKSPEPAR